MRRSPDFVRARTYFKQGLGVPFVMRNCFLNKHQADDLYLRVQKEQGHLAMAQRMANWGGHERNS